MIHRNLNSIYLINISPLNDESFISFHCFLPIISTYSISLYAILLPFLQVDFAAIWFIHLLIQFIMLIVYQCFHYSLATSPCRNLIPNRVSNLSHIHDRILINIHLLITISFAFIISIYLILLLIVKFEKLKYSIFLIN